LGGGKLLGEKPVRMIYMDESGTSGRESVRVVVCLLVHPDRHWKPAVQALKGLKALAPEKYRNEKVHKTNW
jgi:hypothetical protein